MTLRRWIGVWAVGLVGIFVCTSDARAVEAAASTIIAEAEEFEVVSPGTAFMIEIFVENPRPWLLGLLAMGFDQISEGFTALGGFTSRGLGRVSLSWSSITTVTANDLLRGAPAAAIRGDAVAAEMRAWRDALASKYKEAA